METILVFGCRPIGQSVQFAAKAYAWNTVIAVDVNQSRLDLVTDVLSYGNGVSMPPRVRLSPKDADGE